ncbi:DUF2946 domain-containing protein [Dyella silvatica]|uniref:DUF2946 domain-containing protein n=1 Tax=Dyella silvatica TaxID=2992128 RepID=UPI00225C1D25|nr:DUF2946 domain-containing protein [Dyella silvatica]
MLAMLLIVVMPAVSRVMPMPGSMPGMDDACPHHMAGMKHPVAPDGPAHATDRCGYCVLLDHSSMLATGKVLHLVPVAPAPAMPLLAGADAAYVSPILSANPRGPPLIG